MRSLAALSLLVVTPVLADTADPPTTLPLDAALREKCVKVLREGVKSREFWPSMHAAEALTRAGHGKEVREALAMRKSTDDQERCGLARETVRTGDRRPISILFAILDKPGSNGHAHAAESLFKIAEVADGKKLRAALAQNGDIRLKLMACAALARCGHPTALDTVRKRLADPDVELRKVAVWILGQLGNTSDVEPIRVGLKNETEPLAKAYFTHALALLGDSTGRKLLGQNLTSTLPAVRTYAAEFAGYCRAIEFRDTLAKLLDDSTLDVRIRAAQSLLMLSSPVKDHAEVIVNDIYRATNKHPRYSEGSAIVLADSTLLYATTELTNGADDVSTTQIVARASQDGGRSWSDPRAFQENTDKQNVMSVTLRRLKPGNSDGPIGLFYLVKNSSTDLKVYLRISTDEAKTFGKPRCVTDAPGYHVLNNDRVTVLSTGRIIVPVAWSKDTSGQEHFVSFCYYSDDLGQSWSKGEGQVDLPKRGAMEPEVLELADGNLLMIVRTQLGHIATAISKDDGNHWSKPDKLPVQAPEAPATIRRIPATGDLLLVWNNNFASKADHGGKRTPLTAAISTDEGKSWKAFHNMESDPNCEFAYTSVLFVQDRVILTYTITDSKTKRSSSRFRSLPVRKLYEKAK